MKREENSTGNEGCRMIQLSKIADHHSIKRCRSSIDRPWPYLRVSERARALTQSVCFGISTSTHRLPARGRPSRTEKCYSEVSGYGEDEKGAAARYSNLGVFLLRSKQRGHHLTRMRLNFLSNKSSNKSPARQN